MNTADVTQVALAFVRHTLEVQISSLHVGPNLAIGKELFNESQLHIILHPFYIQHCVGKPRRGGALAPWLIGPPIINLAPTNCTSYNTTNLAI
jgi:hypothetical protein